jgi:hypothetical protein
LPRPTFRPDSQNLRHLASNAQYTSRSLQQAQPLISYQILIEQRAPRSHKATNPRRNAQVVVAVLEHQARDGNILDQNKSRLAIRAERKSMAHVVAQRDEVCAGLEQVRQEGQALSGLRVDELEELWNFDDGGRADDGDTEALGDGELEAFRLGGVHVEEQRLVACWADERGSEIGDGFGKIVRDGLDDGSEEVHSCGDRGVWDEGAQMVVLCVGHLVARAR